MAYIVSSFFLWLGVGVTTHKGDRLSRHESTMIYAGKCPDCGARLLRGPEAPGGKNYYCESSVCGSGFCDVISAWFERITNAAPQQVAVRFPKGVSNA